MARCQLAKDRSRSWQPLALRIVQTTLGNLPPSITYMGWVAASLHPLAPQQGPDRMSFWEREVGSPVYT